MNSYLQHPVSGSGNIAVGQGMVLQSAPWNSSCRAGVAANLQGAMNIKISQRRSVRGSRCASVLIAVFWLMAALGLAVFATLFVVHADMEVVSDEKASFRALQLAETGIAIAANGNIKEYDPILQQNPVTDPGLMEYFDFGENEGFSVRIRNESGWLNPNQALLRGDRALLEGIFNFWGMELSEAQEVVSALIDWVDTDDITSAAPEGAEADWYEDNGIGDGNYPFNRAFYEVEEMKFVRGMDLVATYKPDWRDYFTVRSEGPVDLNEASPEIIALAAETDIEWVEDFIIQRDGPDEIKDTEDDLPFNDINAVLDQVQSPPDRRDIISQRFTTRGNTVRIESTGYFGDFQRQLVVVLRNRSSRPALLSREEIPIQ